MKFFGATFIVTVTVLLYARHSQACFVFPPLPPTVEPPTEPPTDQPPPSERTTNEIPPPSTTYQPPPARTTYQPPPPARTTYQPPQTPTRSQTQTTESIPTTPSPECPNITAADSTPGMAPLYGSNFEGVNDYLVVLLDETFIDEVVDRMMDLDSPRNISSITRLSSTNGINAVVADLDEDQLFEVRQINGVDYVEKEVNGTPSAVLEWGLDRIDQRKRPLDNMYTPTGNGKGAIVYVMDSGVNTAHVRFGGRAKKWHEVVRVPEDPKEDCYGHGTQVAGKVGATMYGVATESEIRSVRVYGCQPVIRRQDVIAGINHILKNGNGGIVTMSFQFPKNVALDQQVNKLIKAGYVVVAAAGNSADPGVDVCNLSPARVPKALTVGGIDEMDKKVGTSNFGAGVDLFAPGTNIASLDHETNNQIDNNLQGTSFAAPHVSGVAAILLARGTPANKICEKIIDLSTKNELDNDSLKGSPNRLLYID